MNLTARTKDQAKDLGVAEERRHFYLAAQVVKNNYAPPSDAILLERRDGGYLEKIDPGLVSRASEVNVLYQVKQLLLTDEEGGKHYTRSSFEDKYGGPKGLSKLGRTIAVTG